MKLSYELETQQRGAMLTLAYYHLIVLINMDTDIPQYEVFLSLSLSHLTRSIKITQEMFYLFRLTDYVQIQILHEVQSFYYLYNLSVIRLLTQTII